MKFLIDQPLSAILAEWLRGAGHDAIHARERGLASATDEVLFSLAAAEDRILITTDLDFSRILALSGQSKPGLILFRAGNLTDNQMLELLQRVLRAHDGPILQGAVVVVDQSTMRVATLPIIRRS